MTLPNSAKRFSHTVENYVKYTSFNNTFLVDYKRLEGRALSSSFAPKPEEAEYKPMLSELRSLFERYQQHGKVSINYDCWLYYGQL